MEEYDITFARPVSALENARLCRLRSFAPGASAVLLLSSESSCPPLLLGRMQLISHEESFTVSEEERAALGLTPEGGEDGIEVFCRMTIPADDPLDAGFDLSRLVLTAPSAGKALEIMRPGAPVVSLKRGNDHPDGEN